MLIHNVYDCKQRKFLSFNTTSNGDCKGIIENAFCDMASPANKAKKIQK